MNISDINQPIIPYYSPISAKGGRRHRRKIKTKKHKKSNKSRTRRRYKW